LTQAPSRIVLYVGKYSKATITARQPIKVELEKSCLDQLDGLNKELLVKFQLALVCDKISHLRATIDRLDDLYEVLSTALVLDYQPDYQNTVVLETLIKTKPTVT